MNLLPLTKLRYISSILLTILPSYQTCQEADLSKQIHFNTYVDRGIFWNECNSKILATNKKKQDKWIYLLFRALPPDFETFFKVMNGYNIGFVGNTIYLVGSSPKFLEPGSYSRNPWYKFKSPIKIVTSSPELPRETLSTHSRKYTQRLFSNIRKEYIKKGQDPNTYKPTPYGLAMEFNDSLGALAELKRRIPPRLYCERMIAIGIGGFWDTKHQDLQLTLQRLVRQDIQLATFVLEKYTDDEIASFFYFLFDGPHPEDRESFYQQACDYFSEPSSRNNRLLNLVKKAYEQSEIDTDKYFYNWFEE